MNEVLGTPTPRPAGRWLPALTLSGVLFLAAAWIGLRLGHDHALSLDRLLGELGEAARTVTTWPATSQLLALAALLLTALTAGLAVGALTGPISAFVLGQWPRPLAPVARLLTRRRRHRWGELNRERAALEKVHPEHDRTTEQQDRIDRLAGRINRIAMAEPGRSTWMGDRLRSLAHIAQHRYRFDLAFGWPRLWMVLPDSARRDLTAAQRAFAAAVLVSAWSLPYLALGWVWWPGALLGLGVAAVGWSRARAAIGALTGLAESAVDVHSRTLAIALGVAGSSRTGPVSPDEGREISEITRKGR